LPGKSILSKQLFFSEPLRCPGYAGMLHKQLMCLVSAAFFPVLLFVLLNIGKKKGITAVVGILF